MRSVHLRTVFFTIFLPESLFPPALTLPRRLSPHHLTSHDLSSLRVLGSVDEPIDPRRETSTTSMWNNRFYGCGYVLVRRCFSNIFLLFVFIFILFFGCTFVVISGN
ncbi:hypothetical protein K438DRAFT_1846128 [Mycena galopus ATCC 62051]|nr:hypothetical protein K438DRAFT_1846128 [Mycena galopus ATCC 62051]